MVYASQMRQHVPIMAYNCKLYAVQKGLDLCKENPGDEANQAKSFIIGEMDELTAMKNAMGDYNKEEMKITVENFVLSIFAAADKDERTCEKVGKAQAVAFKRAGDFITVMGVFGDLAPEWEEKRKYCVYKAGNIMQCLKKGEEPQRGNPFAPEEEKNEVVESEQP